MMVFALNFNFKLNFISESQRDALKIVTNKTVEGFIFDLISLKCNTMDVRYYVCILVFIVISLNGNGKFPYDNH